MDLSKSRWLGIDYAPDPEERSYLERAELQKDDTVAVKASVLSNRESERFLECRWRDEAFSRSGYR